MDTSELYIKMCEKAKKDLGFPGLSTTICNIYAVYLPRFFCPKCNKEKKEHIKYCSKCGAAIIEKWGYEIEESNYQRNSEYYFPIWRQDQLQEMLEKPIGFVVDSYWNWMNSWINDNDFYLEDWYPQTAEQILLAALMQVKFNKKWNGEDWEEIKTG